MLRIASPTKTATPWRTRTTTATWTRPKRWEAGRKSKERYAKAAPREEAMVGGALEKIVPA